MSEEIEFSLKSEEFATVILCHLLIITLEFSGLRKLNAKVSVKGGSILGCVPLLFIDVFWERNKRCLGRLVLVLLGDRLILHSSIELRVLGRRLLNLLIVKLAGILQQTASILFEALRATR